MVPEPDNHVRPSVIYIFTKQILGIDYFTILLLLAVVYIDCVPAVYDNFVYTNSKKPFCIFCIPIFVLFPLL